MQVTCVTFHFPPYFFPVLIQFFFFFFFFFFYIYFFLALRVTSFPIKTPAMTHLYYYYSSSTKCTVVHAHAITSVTSDQGRFRSRHFQLRMRTWSLPVAPPQQI